MIHRGKKSLIISFHKLGFLFDVLHIKAGYCADTRITVIKFLLLLTHAYKLLIFSDFPCVQKQNLLFWFVHLT